MACFFQPGDTAFIVDNVRFCREVIVKRVTRDLCVIKYVDSGAVIRIRQSRLFPTKREAELSMPQWARPGISPWEYERRHG